MDGSDSGSDVYFAFGIVQSQPSRALQNSINYTATSQTNLDWYILRLPYTLYAYTYISVNVTNAGAGQYLDRSTARPEPKRHFEILAAPCLRGK